MLQGGRGETSRIVPAASQTQDKMWHLPAPQAQLSFCPRSFHVVLVWLRNFSHQGWVPAPVVGAEWWTPGKQGLLWPTKLGRLSAQSGRPLMSPLPAYRWHVKSAGFHRARASGQATSQRLGTPSESLCLLGSQSQGRPAH